MAMADGEGVKAGNRTEGGGDAVGTDWDPDAGWGPQPLAPQLDEMLQLAADATGKKAEYGALVRLHTGGGGLFLANVEDAEARVSHLFRELRAANKTTPEFGGLMGVLLDVRLVMSGYGELLQQGVSRRRIVRHFVARQVEAAHGDWQKITPYLVPGFTDEAEELALELASLAAGNGILSVDMDLAELEFSEQLKEAIRAWKSTRRGVESKWNRFCDLCEAMRLPISDDPKDIGRDIAKLSRAVAPIQRVLAKAGVL